MSRGQEFLHNINIMDSEQKIRVMRDMLFLRYSEEYSLKNYLTAPSTVWYSITTQRNIIMLLCCI